MDEHELIVDLIALDLKGYDVIFGMDLLSTFRAVMDCFLKRLTLQLRGGVVFSKAGSHLSFLASLIGEEKDKEPKREVLVISDFPDVFPDELPRLPPTKRDWIQD